MGTLTADEIIALLGLEPHPEGGCFRETFRDEVSVIHPCGKARAASTAIYFLLRTGEVSRWHKVDAAEVWHHYAGAPLELAIASPGGATSHVILGTDIAAGERPQAVVPAGHWQRARSLGEFSLVGCTVSPGFEFSSFVLAPDEFDPIRSNPSEESRS